MKLIYTGLVFALLCLVAPAKAQTIPVSNQAFEDYYRRAQLLGKIDSSVSFTVRPISPVSQFSAASAYALPGEENFNTSAFSKWNYPAYQFSGSLLPVTVNTQFNSHHPYGWNDGPMVPSKGLQTYISAGFFAKYGPLTIQLQPEFVYAANQNFDDFDAKHYDVTAARYYDFYNSIELPSRFGTKPFSRAFLGQSSIRLNSKDISFGLSTENLWWGPGIRNALLMSNDAPGFLHFTLNTIKPLKTALGSFEGQLIAGTLRNANQPPLFPDRFYFQSNLYIPKQDRSRHLSGIVLTWQPKWVNGLFLGLTRSSQLYKDDIDGIGDYLPFFKQTQNVTADVAVYRKKDYRSSIFGRWLWPQEHAEVYFEYGHNNNLNDVKDELLEPQDSRAYIVGVRKMFNFNSARKENILISIEAAQLAETSVARVQNAQSWYLNKYITQGYTNYGQSLGAGIGPGGNLQSLDISWVKGLKKIGLQIERFIHNDDFYYYAYIESHDFRRHWVDLSIAANGVWNYKNLVFNAQLQYIKSLNYQYYLDPSLEVVGQAYFINGKRVDNFRLQTGISYRF